MVIKTIIPSLWIISNCLNCRENFLGSIKHIIYFRGSSASGLVRTMNLLHYLYRLACSCNIWLIFTACHLVLGYFMPRSLGIAFIVCSYVHFLFSCFSRIFWLTVRSNMIIFKQIYSTQKCDHNRLYHSGTDWNRE